MNKLLLLFLFFNTIFCMSKIDKQKQSLYGNIISNNASIEMLKTLQYLNGGLMGTSLGYFSHHYPKPKSSMGFLAALYSFYNIAAIQVQLTEHFDEQWRLEQQLKKINKYRNDYKKRS